MAVTEKEFPTKTRTRGALTQPTHILVHYDEIILKQRNRSRFEKELERSIRRALRGLEGFRSERKHGRIVVEVAPDAELDRGVRRLRKVFGATRLIPATRVEPSVDALKGWLDESLLREDRPAPRSFRIRTRRGDKSFPLSSVELNTELGTYVRERTGWAVDLDDAEITVHVRIIPRAAFAGFEEIAGQGGLPFGSTGRVLSLISGGIDSPVASHWILRRGTAMSFVHFHSHPHTSVASQDKVREVIRDLLPPEHEARLHLIPFAPLQEKILLRCPARLRVLLYRRYMLRVAEAIAEREHALALVTGDNLGQVASQTLENLRAIEAAVEIPVLRPLIGVHKRHIIDEAHRIGTYTTSIAPHEDCCSFLMPPNPATRSTPEELAAAEAELDTLAEVAQLVDAAEVETITGNE